MTINLAHALIALASRSARSLAACADPDPSSTIERTRPARARTRPSYDAPRSPTDEERSPWSPLRLHEHSAQWPRSTTRRQSSADDLQTAQGYDVGYQQGAR